MSILNEKRVNGPTVQALWIYAKLIDGMSSPNALAAALDGTLFQRYNELAMRQNEIDWTALFELINLSECLDIVITIPGDDIMAYAWRDVDKHADILAYIQSEVGIATAYDKFRDDTLAVRLWRVYCLIEEAQQDARKNIGWQQIARWMDMGMTAIGKYLNQLKDLGLIEVGKAVYTTYDYYSQPQKKEGPATVVKVNDYRLLQPAARRTVRSLPLSRHQPT